MCLLAYNLFFLLFLGFTRRKRRKGNTRRQGIPSAYFKKPHYSLPLSFRPADLKGNDGEFLNCSAPSNTVHKQPPMRVQEEFADLCCLLSLHLDLCVAGERGKERKIRMIGVSGVSTLCTV